MLYQMSECADYVVQYKYLISFEVTTADQVDPNQLIDADKQIITRLTARNQICGN